jgi:hypothetical protein
MKRIQMVFALTFSGLCLCLYQARALAFVSPAHYEQIKKEAEAKKKASQAPKSKNQSQVVKLTQPPTVSESGKGPTQ